MERLAITLIPCKFLPKKVVWWYNASVTCSNASTAPPSVLVSGANRSNRKARFSKAKVCCAVLSSLLGICVGLGVYRVKEGCIVGFLVVGLRVVGRSVGASVALDGPKMSPPPLDGTGLGVETTLPRTAVVLLLLFPLMATTMATTTTIKTRQRPMVGHFHCRAHDDCFFRGLRGTISSAKLSGGASIPSFIMI